MQNSSLPLVVVGAGIAGLATASALARRGVGRIVVLELEPLIFSRASGHNAAIYRPLEADSFIAELALESLVHLRRLQPLSRVPLLHQRGFLLFHQREEALRPTLESARRVGVEAELVAGSRELTRLSGFELRSEGVGLWAAGGGILDPHEIGQALARELRQLAVPVEVNTRYRSLVVAEGQCVGVELSDQSVLQTRGVIFSGGAASAKHAVQIGSPLPLLPLRRHLAILNVEQPVPRHAAPVWSLEPEVYFRPESDGVLVSPCDETPQAHGAPSSELAALGSLSETLGRLCPSLREGRVRRHWACIRTKTVDGRPIWGSDPHIGGLSWMTGFGGFGMSCGLSAAERFAEQYCGARPADERASPARFRLPCHRTPHNLTPQAAQ